MKLIAELKRKRACGYILTLMMCLCLIGLSVGAVAEAGKAALTITPVAATDDGSYYAQATLSNFSTWADNAQMHKLEALIGWAQPPATLHLHSVGIDHSTAQAVTVQAFDAAGEKNGAQKTLMDSRSIELPEGTTSVKLSFFSAEQDFTLIPSGFEAGVIHIEIAAQPGAQSGDVLGTLTAEVSAATGDAAGERMTIASLQTDVVMGGEAAVETAAPQAVVTQEPVAAQAPAATQEPVATLAPTATSEPVADARIVGGSSRLGAGVQVALAAIDLQASAVTAEDGSFSFEGLAPGEYNVYVPKPEGKTLAEGTSWQLSQKGDMVWIALTLSSGQTAQLPEIVFESLTGVQGCAYSDVNESQTRDSEELLLSGVNVLLQRMENGGWTDVANTVTDDYGAYAFLRLGEGEYRVCAGSDGVDFFVATVGGVAQYEGKMACSQPFTLREGDQLEVDISLQTPASLYITTFLDSDGDGVRGDGIGIGGVAVEIVNGTEVAASGVTGADGVAMIGGIRPGRYNLRLTAPGGYNFTVKGADPANGDSCVSGVDGGVALSDPFGFAAAQTTSAAAGLGRSGTFGGKVFEDLNNDGIMDENDPGVAGVVLKLQGTKTKKTFELISDDTGVYQFVGLPDDRYLFSATLPEGMLYARYSKTGGDLRSVFSGSVVTREFTIKNAEQLTDKNVGVVQNGVMTGTAFLDLNYNGYYDEGEPGYAGVTVEAIKVSNSESMGKTVTGEDGSFRLEGLRGGEYRMRAILPNDGSIFTIVPGAGGEKANYFEQRSTRRENTIQPVTIQSGGETSALVGVAVGASVQGTIFQDADYNGRVDDGERRLSGVAVQIVDEAGNVAASATTDGKGQYILKGIMPGRYTIMVRRINGYGFTRLRPEEVGGSHVVELLDDYGRVAPMDIAMGQVIEGVNAGLLPSATVTGTLFNDVNDDGLMTEDETGLPGASVRLRSDDGEIDLVRAVAADGVYFFDGVMPGSYTLTFLLPEHTEIAKVAQGGNTLENKGQETSTAAFAVAMGENYQYPLVGAVILGNFESMIFNDSNGNGIQDEGEKGISGAEVTLTPDRAGVEPMTAASDRDGLCAIVGLRPAGYKLTVTLPKGMIFSHELVGESLPFSARSTQTLTCSWSILVSRAVKSIGAVAPASVEGVIWLDEDKGGTQAGNEALMSGITVELVDESSATVAARGETTDNGFIIENVRPGAYTARFLMPAQAEPAADAKSTFVLDGRYMRQTGIEVAEGQKVKGLTTGLVSRTSVGGKLWLEAGGVQTPVTGVQVTLWLEGDANPTQTVTTDDNGGYRFDGLWPGEYILRAALPQGMIFVRPDDANFEAGASVIHDIGESEGASQVFTLQMAQHMLDRNVIYIMPAKVGDQVWLDENLNGLIDGGEAMIPGVKLRLTQNGQTIYETTSNEYGYYLFDAVYPGAYVLEAEAYPELTPTTPLEQLRLISSCLTGGDGTKAASDEFSVESGSSNLNFKLGYILLEGQQLPQAITKPQGKDWSVVNQKYAEQEKDW